MEHLYQFSDQYLKALNAFVDAEDDEAMEEALRGVKAIEGPLEEKAENVAKYIRSVLLNMESCRVEAARLTARVKTLLNRANGLRHYLLHELQRVGRDRIEGKTFTVSIRKGHDSVSVPDIHALHPQFVITPEPEPRPDKRAIMDFYKAHGAAPTGAEIVTGGPTLSIR